MSFYLISHLFFVPRSSTAGKYLARCIQLLTHKPLNLNWVIKNSQKLLFHTDLKTLLIPIENEIQNFSWILSDLEINTSELQNIPINQNDNYFYISNKEMSVIRNSDTQIIWGVISAVDKNYSLQIDENNLPFVEGNDNVWNINHFQIEDSIIEIIA